MRQVVIMDQNYFSTSVRALIIRGDNVLVEWFAPKSISFLPGGRIEGEEPLAETLTRELNEELDGLDLEIGEYLGKIGHIWPEGNTSGSCLNHFFVVRERDTNSCSEVTAKESGRSVKWLSLIAPEVDSLQPPSLVTLIKQWREGGKTEWNTIDNITK